MKVICSYILMYAFIWLYVYTNIGELNKTAGEIIIQKICWVFSASGPSRVPSLIGNQETYQ